MRRPLSDIDLSAANFVPDRIEGPNDGPVSATSATWGERCIRILGNGRRGISHPDEIGFRRRPLSKKVVEDVRDVTDFYVSDPAKRGC